MTTPPRPVTLAPLAPGDVSTAAELFARAFDEDRMARLLAPDARQRRAFQERGGRAQIERAMPYRHVFGAYDGDALRGLAVWLPPGVAISSAVAPPLGALPRLARALVQPGAVRLARARRRALAAAHATPSWHLAFLATDPDHRRRGIARRLLEHVLERADADGTPVWLETSDPVNVPLYERFGFATTAHLDGGRALPTFWVMVRAAAARP